MIRAVRTVVILFSCLAAAGCDKAKELFSDQSNGAIAICEKYVQANLQSPSSYKRVKATYSFEQPFSLADFKKFQRTSFCGSGEYWMPCTRVNDDMISMGMGELGAKLGIGHHPTRKQRRYVEAQYWKDEFEAFRARKRDTPRPATAIITYDAQNAYGVALRDIKVCNFSPIVGTDYRPGDMYRGGVVDDRDKTET